MAAAKRVEIPLSTGFLSTSPSFTSLTLNSATPGAVAAGVVCSNPNHNDTITHVGYRQGTTTGTPAANSYTIGLYTVDGSGLPTATDLGGGSPTAKSFTPAAANDSTFQWVQLTNSIPIARGTVFAIVMQNAADTSVNYTQMSYDQSNGATMNSLSAGFPYALTYASPTWTKSSSAFRSPVFGYKSSSYVYGWTAQSGTSPRSTSTSGQRVAAKFTLPSTWGTSFKVVGFRVWGRLGAAASAVKIGLWDATTTLQSIASFDSDHVRSAASSTAHEFYFQDTTLATLTFGTTYYIGLESISSSTVGLTTMDFASANDLLCLPNGGNACYSLYTGSWGDTTTSIPMLTLILDDITPPSGGTTYGHIIGGN